jgi:endogenous inhibitor of DNA gyrase (YacG/DUF329 family)
MGLSFCSSRCTASNHCDRLFQPLPIYGWLERSVQTVELCSSRCSFVRALWLAESYVIQVVGDDSKLSALYSIGTSAYNVPSLYRGLLASFVPDPVP